MNLSTIKQCLGGALMLTALIAAPAMIKASSANALPSHVVEELNITPAQQAELDAIKDNARTQVDAVLTDDQLAALEGKTGRERMRAVRDLDLSDAQRSQLREIRDSARAEADQVFTDDQKAQLEELRAEHQGRRQNRRGNR